MNARDEITFRATNPRTGAPAGRTFREDGAAAVFRAVDQAAAAAEQLRLISRHARAEFLSTLAERLRHEQATLAAIADEETALGQPRLAAELDRAAGQLELQAAIVDEGAYLDATVDHAMD